MLSAIGRPSMARSLYDLVREGYKTSTAMTLREDYGINLNGELPEFPKLVLASNRRGAPLVVKLLRPGDATPFKARDIKTEIKMELDAVRMFGKAHEEKKLAIVPMKVLKVVTAPAQGRLPAREVDAIVLSKYSSPLARPSSQLFLEVILEQGRRIQEALAHIHAHHDPGRATVGFVHMDVKPANIFIDYNGDWFLADFGSMRDKGDTITSTTPGLHPKDLRGKEARPAYDFFMLGITLLMATDLAGDKKKRIREDPESPLSRSLIETRLAGLALESQDLSDLIRALLSADDTAWDPE